MQVTGSSCPCVAASNRWIPPFAAEAWPTRKLTAQSGDGPACGGCRAVATTVTDVDLTALTVGLAAAAVGLLSPVLTYRYMWKMDHERWVRERRADAYVRLTTQVLQYTQTVAGLPDDAPDVGEYLRARSPYTDPHGQETGQLIVAFGTRAMVDLMLSFAGIQGELDKLGGKHDQVPSLLGRLEETLGEMDRVLKRDIQRTRVTGQTATHVDA